MTKFIKTLVIINGLIIPIFVCFLAYKALAVSSSGMTDYGDESVIVGENLEEAKRDNLALQGLAYEAPQEIYNSDNFYLPISVMTYEEARELRKIASSAGDVSPSLFNFFNVIFLDKNYKVIGQLLDKKASVSDIHINRGRYNYQDNIIDQTVKNIAYLIGFNDSNKDGKLNSLDDNDLYISDLNGQNLTQVTFGKIIVDYEFINSNSELFIRFKDKNEIKEEHKLVKFGVYNIATGTLRELKDIENKLLDIESKLVQ